MSHGNLHDGGFTLAEALMALLIISLALAGVMQAGRLVGAFQKRIAGDKKVEAARQGFEHELRDRLSPLQPIESDELEGDAHGVRYACTPDDSALGCRLDVPEGRLAYASSGVTYAAWPQPVKPGSFGKPRLDAIVWRGPGGKVLAVVKFPIEQARDCIFDMISRTCLDPDPVSSAAAS